MLLLLSLSLVLCPGAEWPWSWRERPPLDQDPRSALGVSPLLQNCCSAPSNSWGCSMETPIPELGPQHLGVLPAAWGTPEQQEQTGMLVAGIRDEEAGRREPCSCGVTLHPQHSLSPAHGWFSYSLVKNHLKQFSKPK